MKRIISNIKYTATALCAVVCMSSCEDFLSTVPLNEIVLENFWENEDEVTSVVASCYSGMTDNNFLTRIMLWGEMRSDNMSQGLINPETPFVNEIQLPEMLDGNILPNYYIADWSSFYRVINRCNTVLHYAPEVLERDPDFTESEWLAMEAEMLTLRALCYFYLVRSFRDVPMVLEPSIDDSKPFIMAAANPDSVLNQIVKDLKKAELSAVKKYPETSSSYKISYTKGRVTQQAVWSLLADVALWMENYDECIAYCEKVIAAKVEEAENQPIEGGEHQMEIEMNPEVNEPTPAQEFENEEPVNQEPEAPAADEFAAEEPAAEPEQEPVAEEEPAAEPEAEPAEEPESEEGAEPEEPAAEEPAVDFEAQIAELQNQLIEMTTNYENAQNRIAELEAQITSASELEATLRGEIATYAAERTRLEVEKKNALIERYASTLDEEELADVREHIEEYSYDEIESKLAIKFANKQMAGSADNKVVPLPEPVVDEFALFM